MRSFIKLVVFRVVAAACSTASSIISLKIFLTAAPENASTFIGILGWLAFLPLSQMGFGRPCYGEIRERYVTGELNRELVFSFLRLFQKQAFTATLVFVFLAVGFGLSQGYAGSWFSLVIFVVGMSALASCTLQRDLAYSLDIESAYEVLEAVRKAVTVLIYGLIYIGTPLEIAGIIAASVAVSTYVVMNRKILRKSMCHTANDVSVSHWRCLLPDIGRKARQYFGFSVNELVFYNLPLILFTVFPSPENIVFFGVWSKLFLVVTLPMRILIDSQMNGVTSHYFSGQFKSAWRALSRCALVGGLIVLCLIVALSFIQKPLLAWLNAKALIGNSWILISLAFWAAGNVIQHTYGSFTLSYRNGFNFAYRASLVSLLIVGGTLIACYAVNRHLGLALALSGFMYMIFAVTYMWHARRVIGDVPSNSLV
jgi:hypothetical protein